MLPCRLVYLRRLWVDSVLRYRDNDEVACGNWPGREQQRDRAGIVSKNKCFVYAQMEEEELSTSGERCCGVMGAKPLVVSVFDCCASLAR